MIILTAPEWIEGGMLLMVAVVSQVSGRTSKIIATKKSFDTRLPEKPSRPVVAPVIEMPAERAAYPPPLPPYEAPVIPGKALASTERGCKGDPVPEALETQVAHLEPTAEVEVLESLTADPQNEVLELGSNTDTVKIELEMSQPLEAQPAKPPAQEVFVEDEPLPEEEVVSESEKFQLESSPDPSGNLVEEEQEETVTAGPQELSQPEALEVTAPTAPISVRALIAKMNAAAKQPVPPSLAVPTEEELKQLKQMPRPFKKSESGTDKRSEKE